MLNAPAPPPSPSPFAAVAERDLTFSGHDTSHLPPSRAASSSSSALHNTMCVCEFVCMCHGERQTQRVVNRRTGRLVICLSAFRLTKHWLFVTTQCTCKFEWRRDFFMLCLSMWKESRVLRRPFRASQLTWWLPWEQPDSGRLCTSFLRGDWENREEV